MEILLAESLGFCMGVKRAVELAYRARAKAEGQPVVTLGPLIHNQPEIERLAVTASAWPLPMRCPPREPSSFAPTVPGRRLTKN